MNKVALLFLAAIFSAIGIAPASAQSGTSLSFTSDDWANEGFTRTQYAQGIQVRVEFVRREEVLGENKFYVRGEFCNRGSEQPWRGGQRISGTEQMRSHAALNIAPGQCRTWSEYVPANVRTIYVYVISYS